MESLKLRMDLLSLQDVDDVAMKGRKVELSSEAIQKIKSRHILSSILKFKRAKHCMVSIRGLAYFNVKIPSDQIETQSDLLRSHACGIGSPLDESVRAMLLLEPVI